MRSILLFAALLTGTVAVPAQAQTIWSRPYEPNQIAVEVLVPDLPTDDASGRSGATFLTATRSLNENIELAAELPAARYAATNTTATTVGNPYVGVGLSSTRIPLLVELGVRIPAAPNPPARTAGRHADAGRTAAFRDESISVSGLLNGRLSLNRYTTLRLRTGLTYGSPAADSTADTTGKWRLPYSVQLWRDGERFMTGLSIAGRPSLSPSAPGPDRSTHHAMVSLMLNGTRVQPGVLLGTDLTPLFTEARVALIGGVTLSISYDR